ncbi:MAG: DUF6263 family protein [Planctomycetota bacterium]|jgi:hypothetical protein
MTLRTVFALLTTTLLVSLIMMSGCAGPGEQGPEVVTEPKDTGPKIPVTGPVTLALEFAQGQSATYRVTMEDSKSVEFEGSMAKDGAFKGGRTGSRAEIDFARHIQSVDERGNAVATITIKALKYLAQEKDAIRLDFDSTSEADQKDPLRKLIGQRYTIEISPGGQVTKVADTAEALTAVRGATPGHRRASALLKSTVIKERHSIPAMPGADKSEVNTGDDWSNVKTFDFTMMGKKSYERIYSLKQIEETDGRQIAVVEMNAIPTTEGQQPDQAAGALSKMFDDSHQYTGQLRLDLTTGQVEKYVEKLKSEWFLVDPAAKPTDPEPDALKMTAIRSHSVERID